MPEVKHIKHNAIDFKKWDKTILSSECPLVFAQAFYLNATCPKWDALIVGDYESVFPLTRKSKFGVNYLPQPSFTSQLGVFGEINDEIETAFYNYISNKFKLIEIELNSFNKLNVKGISKKRTYVINYNHDYKYNQNTKRNIKKAMDSGLVVKKAEERSIMELSQSLIDPFLKHDLKLSNPVIKVFNVLLQAGLTEKQLHTFKTVDAKSDIKALAHFVSNGKHVLYLKGTNFDKKANSGSMHLLIDHAIKYFEGKAITFDFGGGSKAGLAGFYEGLGGIELKYSYLKINRLSDLVKLLKSK